MIWDTDSINRISEEIDKGRPIKSILRDISINSILSPNDNTSPTFPFYISNTSNSQSHLNKWRSSNIPFNLSNYESQQVQFFKENPTHLYKLIKNRDLSLHEISWIDLHQKSNYNLVTVPLQVGSSSLLLFCLLHYITFNHNKSLILSTYRSDSVDSFLSQYESLPFYLKLGIKYIDNYKFFQVKFDNNSSIRIGKFNAEYLKLNFDFIAIDTSVKDISIFNSNHIGKVTIIKNEEDNDFYKSIYFDQFSKLNINDYTKVDNLHRSV